MNTEHNGETIQDQRKQMERWVEHYSLEHSLENNISEAAFNAIQPLPILEELDAEPTVDGLKNATDDLPPVKHTEG